MPDSELIMQAMTHYRHTLCQQIRQYEIVIANFRELDRLMGGTLPYGAIADAMGPQADQLREQLAKADEAIARQN